MLINRRSLINRESRCIIEIDEKDGILKPYRFSFGIFLEYCFIIFRNIDLFYVELIMFPLPSRIFCSIGPAVEPQRSQRYRRRYFVDSVFPAPDSPDTMMLWDCFNTFISLNALSPAKIKEEDSLCTLIELKMGREKKQGHCAYRWRRHVAESHPRTFLDKSW